MAQTTSINFAPPPDRIDQVLTDLTSAAASLASVAAIHNTTVHALALWLAQPAIRARVALLESAGFHHVRLVASLNLTPAIGALSQILRDFAERATCAAQGSPTKEPTSLDLRHAEIARKTAWLLHRLSRVTPLSEADLARAARPTNQQTNGPTHPDGQTHRDVRTPIAPEQSVQSQAITTPPSNTPAIPAHAPTTQPLAAQEPAPALAHAPGPAVTSTPAAVTTSPPQPTHEPTRNSARGAGAHLAPTPAPTPAHAASPARAQSVNRNRAAQTSFARKLSTSSRAPDPRPPPPIPHSPLPSIHIAHPRR